MIGPWTTDPNQLDGIDLYGPGAPWDKDGSLPGLFCDCVR